MDNEIILSNNEISILLSAMYNEKDNSILSTKLYKRLENILVTNKAQELKKILDSNQGQDLEFHKMIMSLRKQKTKIDKAIEEINELIEKCFE